MLEHAHRGNLVVGAGFVELTIIEQFHAYTARQSPLLNQAVYMRMLVFGQGDTCCVEALGFGRPKQQAAPTGPHVQDTFALRPLAHAADVTKLGLLWLRPSNVGLLEIRAGITPARVQPQR